MGGRLNHLGGSGKCRDKRAHRQLQSCRLVLIIAVLLAISLTGGSAEAGVMTISRASTGSTGLEGNGGGTDPAVSADGRFVAFSSTASNLGAGDADATADVFLKDTHTGAITLVSVSTLGEKGDGSSAAPTISADGRFVAFWSYATNLSSGDHDFVADIFLRDTVTNVTTLISTSTDGLLKGNFDSYYPSISDDGRYVAFESSATNLIAADNNNKTDIFVKDTITHITWIMSATSAGNPVVDHSHRPAISGDGSRIAFWSNSGMGTGDIDNTPDIFIKNRVSGAVTLASTSTGGVKGNAASYEPSLSRDGRYVAFESSANNLVAGDTNALRDIFIKDTNTGLTTRVSTTSAGDEGEGGSYAPSLSADGHYVAFHSTTSDLGNDIDGQGHTDVFLKDNVTGSTELISQGNAGALAGGNSRNAAISADGRYVAFASGGDNLVPGDENTADDVFISHSGPRYGFTWYDDQYAANWILFANPRWATGDAWFDVSVAGLARSMPSLPGYSPGQVPKGGTLFARYGDLMGGPVDAGYHGRSPALISQRILWAGNSLEEVVGTDSQKLSNLFYWTWYDEVSPGYKNWVLISNPTAGPVYYKIKVEGVTRASGQIPPGANVTPRFPGVMGGPVEVEAWSDEVDGQVPAYVMASQRVLSNGDTAFNEVPGIPADELASNYFWTWYDMQSPGAANWVLIAHPDDNVQNIYYEIMIGDDPEPIAEGGPILRGDTETRTFPGSMGGPVQVRTYLDVQHLVEAEAIVSQRVIWGPSFEEVPGDAVPLGYNYHWTWYDMQSPGAQNWVLIANPVGAPFMNYEIRIGGVIVDAGGPIAPGLSYTTQFPGEMGGPVEVTTTQWGVIQPTPSPSIVSQRVLWNGYFNEVPGTSLN